MTRSQQETTRALHHAKKEWLRAYGWEPRGPDRFWHRAAPQNHDSYTIRDAIMLTEGNPLGYSIERLRA